MLTVVIFFLFLSSTIVLGIATPIMKHANIARENFKSKASYYAAESALEDVDYRIINDKTVAASETLNINNSDVTITTATTFSGKQVTATSNRDEIVRKLQSLLVKGEGVVFKYGTQAGQGGMFFGNNSFLEGSLYSNGNIIGGNNSYITGDAFVVGTNGLLDNVDVGTSGTGSAHAYQVTGSSVTGTIYCKIGSGNNKACNTTEDLPEPIDFPISNEEIGEWKNDALTGGVSTGNMTISSPTTLGPIKIVGNLTINSTLTIANTIWVTGNITMNGTVRLASSFGATSGIMVTDGYINVGNGVVFQDSGTAGSYILLLSTSNCDESMSGSPCNGNNAIDIGNNSVVAIANAQQGTVSFSNNAGVKEAVGNKIRLSNNASIEYGSGITNVNFTSGPGGGYVVTDWGEVQ